MDLPGLALLPVAAYGLWRIQKDIRRLFRHRHERSTVATLERLRIVAWLAPFAALVPIAIVVLVGGPLWMVYAAFGFIAVAWLLFLVLSFAVGLKGGGSE